MISTKSVLRARRGSARCVRSCAGVRRRQRTGCRSSEQFPPSCDVSTCERCGQRMHRGRCELSERDERDALGAARPPRVVRGGIPDLDLGVRVALDRVLGHPGLRCGAKEGVSGRVQRLGERARGERGSPHDGLAHALDTRHGCRDTGWDNTDESEARSRAIRGEWSEAVSSPGCVGRDEKGGARGYRGLLCGVGCRASESSFAGRVRSSRGEGRRCRGGGSGDAGDADVGGLRSGRGRWRCRVLAVW